MIDLTGKKARLQKMGRFQKAPGRGTTPDFGGFPDLGFFRGPVGALLENLKYVSGT